MHVVRGKQKLFGFRWNKDTDQLSYGLQANLIGVDIPTRRMLIQFFVSLFDPLGGSMSSHSGNEDTIPRCVQSQNKLGLSVDSRFSETLGIDLYAFGTFK